MQVTDNQPKRVLHVLACMDRGGIETWLMFIMRGLDRKKLNIDVCNVNTTKEGAYSREFSRLGGREISCVIAPRWQRLTFEQRFRLLLRENKYDVVHSHIFLHSGIIMKYAAKEHVPVRVAHIHAPSDFSNKKRIWRTLHNNHLRKKIDKYATKILTPSRGTMTNIFGDGYVNDNRYEVMHNFVPLSAFDGEIDKAHFREQLDIPEEGKIALTIGRYFAHKNQEWVVSVAEEVCKKRNDVYFVLNGAAPTQDYLNYVKNLVKIKNLEKYFRFIGPFEDLLPVWKSADMFLFPSKIEGFGIVIIEAGAACLPVVASDIVGIREAAAGCRNIKLLSLDLSAGDWAKEVINMLEDGKCSPSEARQQIIQAGFSLQTAMEKLLKMYRAD